MYLTPRLNAIHQIYHFLSLNYKWGTYPIGTHTAVWELHYFFLWHVRAELCGIKLVSTHKSAWLGESGLLDECAPQILRCAQDDSLHGMCHPERVSRSPERSEG